MSGWELNFIKNISIDEKLKGSGNKPRPSNARRKRMESLQRMEVPRKVQPLTALERKLLDRSQEALAMKNIMKNAETLQARDHQLFERKRKQEDELRYEGEMHDMMIEDQQNALRDQVRQDELKALKARRGQGSSTHSSRIGKNSGCSAQTRSSTRRKTFASPALHEKRRRVARRKPNSRLRSK